jgi:hypothetical protein
MNARQSSLSRDDLSTSDLKLIEVMNQIGFGRIGSFRVSNGRAVVDPKPRTYRSVNTSAETESPRSPWVGDYLEKRYARVITSMRELQEGEITRIDMQNGIPVHLEIGD